MTLLTVNPDVLCDAKVLEAWRPDWVEPHAILPADLDVQKMPAHVALAEVMALGASWTKQVLADARASARHVARRGLCCKGEEAMIEDFLVTRCEAICERMRRAMVAAVVDATFGNPGPQLHKHTPPPRDTANARAVSRQAAIASPNPVSPNHVTQPN